jgi:adenylate kinase family enzyme
MSLIVNIWGGPGSGKSSTAAHLFAKMKQAGYSCELVSEEAKKIVWEGHLNLLEDQWYISAMQNRKLMRLKGKVDYIITDSPLLMGTLYMDSSYPQSLRSCVEDINDYYCNYHAMLNRVKPFVQAGRSQDEEGARRIDTMCRELLEERNLCDFEVDGDSKAAKKIMQNLLQYA